MYNIHDDVLLLLLNILENKKFSGIFYKVNSDFMILLCDFIFNICYTVKLCTVLYTYVG